MRLKKGRAIYIYIHKQKQYFEDETNSFKYKVKGIGKKQKHLCRKTFKIIIGLKKSLIVSSIHIVDDPLAGNADFYILKEVHLQGF